MLKNEFLEAQPRRPQWPSLISSHGSLRSVRRTPQLLSHRGRLCVSATVNNAAANIGVHTPLRIHAFKFVRLFVCLCFA